MFKHTTDSNTQPQWRVPHGFFLFFFGKFQKKNNKTSIGLNLCHNYWTFFFSKIKGAGVWQKKKKRSILSNCRVGCLAAREVDSALRHKSQLRLEALPLTPCFRKHIPKPNILSLQNSRGRKKIIPGKFKKPKMLITKMHFTIIERVISVNYVVTKNTLIYDY